MMNENDKQAEPVVKYCCQNCFKSSGQLLLDRMILCSECGNKRCPKATNHELPCTNSNEPGQVGSVYTHPAQPVQPAAPLVRLTDEEIKVLQAFHNFNVCTTSDKDLVTFANAIMDAMIQKNGGKHD